MPKFQVDTNEFMNSVNRRPSYKLADVQDKLEKVAFDVCRFRDGNVEELWRIEEGDDGPYIVALYKDEEGMVATASIPDWSVVVKDSNLHVFYKNEYVTKVAQSELGFGDKDINLARQYLPSKLASSKPLVKSLLARLDPSSTKQFMSKYPELA